MSTTVECPIRTFIANDDLSNVRALTAKDCDPNYVRVAQPGEPVIGFSTEPAISGQPVPVRLLAPTYFAYVEGTGGYGVQLHLTAGGVLTTDGDSGRSPMNLVTLENSPDGNVVEIAVCQIVPAAS